MRIAGWNLWDVDFLYTDYILAPSKELSFDKTPLIETQLFYLSQVGCTTFYKYYRLREGRFLPVCFSPVKLVFLYSCLYGHKAGCDPGGVQAGPSRFWLCHCQ
jgi:hypothetical protein